MKKKKEKGAKRINNEPYREGKCVERKGNNIDMNIYIYNIIKTKKN